MNANNPIINQSKVRGWFENSAKLYEERVRDLSLLRRLSDSISLEMTVEEAARFILDIMIDELNVCNGSIMMVNPDTETLSVKSARGHHSQCRKDCASSETSIVLHKGEGVAGTVFETGVPVLVPDVESDNRFTFHADQAVEVGSLICLPLSVRGEVVGVLNLSHENRFAFVESDLHGLAVAGNQIAMMLDHAENYQRLAQANHDLESRIRERTVHLEQTNEELIKTRSSLVQAERLSALGQMASGVAHDFNNTLAGIIGNIQMLMNRVEDEEFKEYLKAVEMAALDGAATIKRIQEFSRVNRDANFEPLSLNRLIEDTLKVISPIWKDQAQKKSISIEIDKEFGDTPNVEGNAPELREVFANIIINAVEAMPEGGHITIRTWAEGDRSFASVTDTGVGISRTVQDRLFDPFYTSKGPSNSGLGLSVAYGIVCRHEGNIEVVSEESVGTTFTLDFPSTDKPEKPVSEEITQVASESARILVIDDDDSVRNVLVAMLKHLGHDVVFARDGASGVEQLDHGEFSMVLTDLGMPGMSGWDVASAVKAKYPETPVVLITGWGREIGAEEAARNRVDFVLPKPFQLCNIASMIESVQANHRNAA